jgi:8-oxo-dGTP pyrophosphatase MutT (NUDIX family)
MLRLIPAPLHRFAYRTASALRARWRRVVKPSLRGCRVIGFDGEGRIAFVRLSYGFAGWSLPGGGLGRSENPRDGARREFREETGCTLADPVVLGISEESSHGAPNRVYIVAGDARGEAVADGREVLEVAWFPPDFLPDAMSPRLRAALPGWITAAKAADRPGEVPPPAPPPAPTR